MTTGVTRTKVGGYVLGNFITSVIAGLGIYFWLLAFGIPYPLCQGADWPRKRIPAG
jgi:predicted PurR-regulated permease PerM